MINKYHTKSKNMILFDINKMDYTSTVAKINNSIAIVFALKGNQITSKGSGFIYEKKGIMVTCNHVIQDSDLIVKIKFPSSEEYLDAKVVIRDVEHDIALLKFTDDTREPLIPADDTEIKEGMSILFSGFPLTLLNLTTHQGILSAIIKDATGVNVFLIDGTVNSGNSGCPLMTTDGKVIGVINAKRRERSDLLTKVEQMALGSISLHGIDLVEIYHALISNIQLGIGYAVPSRYIPQHIELDKKSQDNFKKKKKI